MLRKSDAAKLRVTTQHELVAVGRDTPLHRQVADVEVQRFSSEPVHHLDTEGRERVAGGLLHPVSNQAQRKTKPLSIQ